MPHSHRPVPGVYDSPVTNELEVALAKIAPELIELERLEPSEAPRALAHLLSERLIHAFASLSTSDDDGLERQVELANKILELAAKDAPHGGAEERMAKPARKLLAVRTRSVGLGSPTSPIRPNIPLATSDLIVNGHHDVSLGPEVKRELASADRVDLLCSFLKWSGIPPVSWTPFEA